MLVILSSLAAIQSAGHINQSVVQALAQLKAMGYPVGILSNRAKPAWFDNAFAGTGVEFVQEIGRQNGEFIKRNAPNFNVQPYDIVVLAASDDDIPMAKNGGGLLIAAGWVANSKVTNLGIKASTPQEFLALINLFESWNGHWWYEVDQAKYDVRALVDLSTLGKGTDQRAFGDRLKATVKKGGTNLNALLAVTARSLLIDGVHKIPKLMWGVYPSSSSSNNDTEVLSDFTSRLRTTVSTVHMARKGIPLFIRHKASAMRHTAGAAVNRNDPSDQILTIHLNPAYKKSIVGKNVIVIDDCTTYGVSFAVASAFLLKAGAASVRGVALGKFGSTLGYHDITLTSDPFSPIPNGGYQIANQSWPAGRTNPTAQALIRQIL